jgi:hypothetical protein
MLESAIADPNVIPAKAWIGNRGVAAGVCRPKANIRGEQRYAGEIQSAANGGGRSAGR